MDELQKTLLMQVAGLHEVPAGAYNIRANGEAAGRQSTEHIEIVPKEDQPGIDIFIKPGTKKESVHIPVLMTQTGLKELVYNDFHIGEDCDVTIVAGCGIHNGGDKTSEHSGIHSFFIGKNSKVRYVEKHYGSGEGTGERVMNPETIVNLDEDVIISHQERILEIADKIVVIANGEIQEIGSKAEILPKLLDGNLECRHNAGGCIHG